MAKLTLLDKATATTTVPTGPTDGKKLWKTTTIGEGLWRGTDRALVLMYTDGDPAAAANCTLKLRGYQGDLGKWTPLGTSSTDANRGLLNEENAIGEVAAGDDELFHSEIVEGLRGFQRADCEVVSLNNVDTNGITVILVALALEAGKAA